MTMAIACIFFILLLCIGVCFMSATEEKNAVYSKCKGCGLPIATYSEASELGYHKHCIEKGRS